MTAAVYRNTPTLSVPPSQNTAPVLEFNCLYTHDVKKKAKKWQDGFLRYHTFNKRVMVYDVPRNLVGDMHWTGDEPLQEGDELRLERNGAMVEVGDSVGQVEADLSELRKSTKKPAKSGIATTPARTAPNPAARLSTAQNRSSALSRSNTQLKHRSLNALLGTPKGPIGKAALPQKSPHEERQEVVDLENEEWEEGRPPKRARTDNAAAWSVTRTSKTTKSVKPKETPLWARTADASKLKKRAALQTGQQKLGTTEVVELSDDDTNEDVFLPGFSDAALAPSSPRKEKPKRAQGHAARSSSPGLQMQQRLAREERSTAATERAAQPHREDAPSSHRGSDAEANAPEQTGAGAQEEIHKPQPQKKSSPPGPARPTSSRPGQKLRLAASAPKKKTLLCQDQLKKKPKRLSSTNTDVAVDSLLNIADSDDDRARDTPKTTRETYKDRLARIDKKRGSTSSTRLQSASKKAPEPIEIPSGNESSSEAEEDDDSRPVRPATSHETSAMELRRPDEMMLPPAPPRVPTSRTMSPEPNPPSPEPRPQPRAAPTKQPERPLRRVVSEIQRPPSRSKRIPGAPVRFTPTPSPTKQSRETTPAANIPSRPAIPSVLDPKPRPPPPQQQKSKRPLSKSVSLNVTANGTSAVMLSKPFQAPGKAAELSKMKPPAPPEPQGPWTKEAFDLFVWRPPNWDEEKWCLKEEKETGDQNAAPPVGLSGGVSMPFK